VNENQLHLLFCATFYLIYSLCLPYVVKTEKVKKVKVGFFYSAPRPTALYNRRKWQLIGKSHWCCGHPLHALTYNWTRVMQLANTPPLQSTTLVVIWYYGLFFLLVIMPVKWRAEILVGIVTSQY